MERAFQAYREPLETVISFKYLGRVLMVGDNNWPEVTGNLSTSSKIWMQMTRILIQEGENPKVSGLLFKVVFQAVLLFRA